MNNFKRKKSFAYLLTLATVSILSLSACSSTSKDHKIYDSGNVISDPYEEMNRKVFAFNMAFDHVLLNPIIKGYRTITPEPARTGLQNFLRNLRSPVDLANQLLQGDLEGAKNITLRAIINTSVGVGGLFDVAGYEGIEYEPEDFGQTLAKWGVGHGPYFVVPFIGASSLRDYSGYFVDSVANPLRIYLDNIDKEDLYYAKAGADYLILRDSLHDSLIDLENSSFDYYAAVRSTYYQHRKALVNDYSNNHYNEYELPEIPYYDDDF